MKNSYDLVIVSILDNIVPIESFPNSEWPLHLTITSIFSLECELEELCNDLRREIGGTTKFEVTIGQDALFGPKNNVPVSLVEKNNSLLSLHNKLVDLLADKYNAYFLHPDFLHNNYRPHVSKQKTGFVATGEKFCIEKIQLVDRNPYGDSKQRRIINSFSLAQI